MAEEIIFASAQKKSPGRRGRGFEFVRLAGER